MSPIDHVEVLIYAKIAKMKSSNPHALMLKAIDMTNEGWVIPPVSSRLDALQEVCPGEYEMTMNKGVGVLMAELDNLKEEDVDEWVKSDFKMPRLKAILELVGKTGDDVNAAGFNSSNPRALAKYLQAAVAEFVKDKG